MEGLRFGFGITCLLVFSSGSVVGLVAGEGLRIGFLSSSGFGSSISCGFIFPSSSGVTSSSSSGVTFSSFSSSDGAVS